MPKHHFFTINGVPLQAEQLLAKRNKCFLDNVLISGQYLSVALKKLSDDYLIVLTNTFAHQALNTYRQRWTIEVFFQAIKQRGFHLESTHLQDLNPPLAQVGRSRRLGFHVLSGGGALAASTLQTHYLKEARLQSPQLFSIWPGLHPAGLPQNGLPSLSIRAYFRHFT